MFELLFLAAATATAQNQAPPVEPPSLEMLEFLGDWNEEEARALDETTAEAAAEEPDRKTRHEPQDR